MHYIIELLTIAFLVFSHPFIPFLIALLSILLGPSFPKLNHFRMAIRHFTAALILVILHVTLPRLSYLLRYIVCMLDWLREFNPYMRILIMLISAGVLIMPWDQFQRSFTVWVRLDDGVIA